METDTSLHFSLLRLQLIELIRACTTPQQPGSATPDISAALDFATTHLAPRAPTDPQFLSDLEKTMALLIFPPGDNLAPQLAELIDPSLRKQVANRVNEAILHSQGAKREARLRSLVKLRAWSEKKAREMGRDLPDRLGIGLDGSGRTENGKGNESGVNAANEDTVMAGNGTTSNEGNGNSGGDTHGEAGEAMVT